MTVRRITLALLLVLGAALLLAPPAGAMERGHWMVRGRVVSVIPDDHSGSLSGVAGSGLGFDTNVTFAVDLSYYFTPHFSLDLSLTDSEHQIEGEGTLNGMGDMADVRLFPPTLTARWHFAPSHWVQPYVGGGVNYTHFHDEDPSLNLADAMGPSTRISLDDTWGWTLQGGVDIYFHDHWSFNIDVKYMEIDSEVTIETQGTPPLATHVSIDPWVTGMGVGFRF